LQDSFIKWPGNKTDLLSNIITSFPSNYNEYYEPFLGSGAILFQLKPTNAIINDINSKLINCYYGVKSNVVKVMQILDEYQDDRSIFLGKRDLYNSSNYNILSIEEKAALLIYLSKTCFRGLYRENSRGEFNQSYGQYNKTSFYDYTTLISSSNYLNNNKVSILNDHYLKILKLCKPGDLIYLDPPYYNDDLTKIRKYTNKCFGRVEHQQLKEAFDLLSIQKCYCVQSSYDEPFIRELYKKYNIIKLPSYNRRLDQNKVTEILITNY